MGEAKYPQLAEHITKHKKLTIKVVEFIERFNKFETVNTADLLKFLQEWLLKHIAMEDKQYGMYINQQQKAKPSMH